jgi:flagellar hook protein FlgE
LSTISDNISNSETKGYKRANMEFSSLVLTERPASYDAGGVRASTVRDIDDQGALLSTRNNMDLAISGRGFLPVTDIAAVQRNDPDLPPKLMRTGSFRPDEDGIFRTNSGYALMAFKALDDGTFDGDAVRESARDLVPVNIGDINLAAEPTTNINLRANLDARLTGYDTTASPPDPVPDPVVLPVTYFDVLGGEETLTFSFQALETANRWELTVTDGGATPAVDLGTVTLNFTGGSTTGGPPAGFLAAEDTTTPINSGVHIAATVTDIAFDDSTGNLTLTGMSDGGTRTVSIGSMEQIGPLTQFKADSAPSVTKNGSPVSNITGVEINESGIMDAIFDSGFRKTIYKIPIGNVQNPNGLNTSDGPVYTLSRESGNIYFHDAGAGPTGNLVSNALEESTTDIAEELTSLIKTQRAYSSNAKIIQTVDEMLQETTNLKR